MLTLRVNIVPETSYTVTEATYVVHNREAAKKFIYPTGKLIDGSTYTYTLRIKGDSDSYDRCSLMPYDT